MFCRRPALLYPFFFMCVCGGSAMYSWLLAKLITTAHQSVYRLLQCNRQQKIHHAYTQRETLSYAAAVWRKTYIPLPHEFVRAIGLIQSLLKPEERLGHGFSQLQPNLSFSAVFSGDSQRKLVFCASGAFHFSYVDSKKQLFLPAKNSYGVFYKVTRVVSHRTC